MAGTISGGASTASNIQLPQLNNPVVKDRSNTQAVRLEQNLNAYYEDTFAPNYRSIQTAVDRGMDPRQAVTAVAADLATINNMQRELAHAVGDVDMENLLRRDPSMIATAGAVAGDHNQDGWSTSAEIINGAEPDGNYRFVFSGVNNSATGLDDGSQQVTATLEGTNIQATSAFQGGAATAADAQGRSISSNQSSNSDEAGTNINWSGTTNTGQGMTGGVYVAAKAERTTQLALENIRTATPAQQATAFAYLSSLPDNARSAVVGGMLPQAQAAWAQIQAVASRVANAPDPARNSDSFNALYNAFASRPATRNPW